MKSKKTILLVSIIVSIILILIAGGVTVLKITKSSSSENNLQGSNSETSKTEVPDEYIGIYTAEDFLKFNTQEYSLDGKYILMKDIDFSSIETFTPIGHYEGLTYPKEFTGILDGNHYTISNINLKSSKDLEGDFGLFSNINGGTIKNLNIKDAKVVIDQVPNYNSIGLLAGSMTNSLIENCNFSDIKFEINGTAHLSAIGTIAGKFDTTSVFRNPHYYEGYNKKDENSNSEYAVARNIKVDVEVTGNHISESTEFGGAFGEISGVNGKVEIKIEDIIVNLKNDSEYIATSGLATSTSRTEIQKCGTNVDINSPNAKNVAGFINSTNNSIINQCYAKGQVTANNNFSGFINHASGHDSIKYNEIKDSYSTVTIIVTDNSTKPYVSNFIRYTGVTLKNIYASGKISNINGTEIEKALVYDMLNRALIEDAYYNINEINAISANAYPLGMEAFKEDYPKAFIALTEEKMKNKSSYPTFDFENIWGIDEGESTPYLKFEKKK